MRLSDARYTMFAKGLHQRYKNETNTSLSTNTPLSTYAEQINGNDLAGSLAYFDTGRIRHSY